jgi:hypothetical protein
LTVRLNGSVRLSPPDVPVIVSVAFVGGATPPPHPLTSNDVAINIAKPAVATTRAGRLCDRLIRGIRVDASRKSGANAAIATGNLVAFNPKTNGISAALEVFDTVTMNAEPVDPLTVTDAGDTEHVEDIGAPVQVRATVPLNPLFGVTCKSYLALCPDLMAAAVRQLPPAGQLGPLGAAMAKSVPVPTRPKL